MHTIAYTEIEHAEKTDIGKIALCYLSGPTLAIEDLLSDAIRVAEANAFERLPEPDTHTDPAYLDGDTLIAVIVGAAVEE